MALRKLKPFPAAVRSGAALVPVHWKMQAGGNPALPAAAPQQRLHKFEPVLLYLLQQIGKKHNTQAALCNMLYFLDFDFYEIHEEQFIGAKYFKNGRSPAAPMFLPAAKKLAAENKIQIANGAGDGGQTRYAPVAGAAADLSVLAKREVEHIHCEISRFAGWSEKRLSELSRLDTPWRVAKQNQPLKYEYVFYRPEQTSVREYEPL